MSHGFSRFGPPSARDRFHQQARPTGTFAMLLPTIFATLFMFTIVVTLNKAGNMSRGGKIVRLLNVDDVFPTELDVEQNRKKEFWELTPPPPSPEAVMEEGDLANLERWNANPDWQLDGDPFLPPGAPPLEADIMPLAPTAIPGFAPTTTPAPRTTAPSTPRTASIPTPEIQLPAVAPDTSLPVATPTP